MKTRVSLKYFLNDCRQAPVIFSKQVLRRWAEGGSPSENECMLNC